MRGDEITGQHDYRILAVGGSTTECLFLDQDESWPAVLQRLLNGIGDEPHVWVGDIGVSVRATKHHVLQLHYGLPQWPRIDTVLVLARLHPEHCRGFVIKAAAGPIA